MQLKTDLSQSPTFNYFVKIIKHNPEKNSAKLLESHNAAMNYIKEHYPKAKPGNNYWLHEIQAPLVDQYFLRCYTFRSCIPPYHDKGLNAFKKEVEAFVRKEIGDELELETTSMLPNL